MPEKKMVFYSPAGDKIREDFLFDENMQLQKVGEHDIQKEINEAAKGLKISEQIERMARGDMTVMRSGEPTYGDVSEVPESKIDEIKSLDAKVAQAVQAAMAKKQAETKKEVVDTSAKIAELEAQLAAIKGDKENAK